MLFLDICACEEFVAIAMNNKASYIMTAIMKEKEFTANFVKKIIELLYYENFISRKFQLNIF